MPRWLKVDPLVLGLIAVIAFASIVPAKGDAADVVNKVVVAVIAILFFLYGVRLSPEEVVHGVRNWRLNVAILAFTFVVYPLIGIALKLFVPHWLGSSLYTGVLYLTLVPSTLNSSIAFTSIAKGNVSGAMVAASPSTMLGMALTPLLVVVMSATGLMNGVNGGVHIGGSQALDIVLQMLLPFVLGMLARAVIGQRIIALANHVKKVDRFAILLVVYNAFSEGMRAHIWSLVGAGAVFGLIALAIVLVVVGLWLTRLTGERLGFSRGDVIALQFCGTKKSLLSGLPMASVLFAGHLVSLVVLPLMIFHQVQLMMCSWLAARYAQTPSEV